MANPRVIGAFAKTHLEVIDASPDDLGARIRMGVDPLAIGAIEKAGLMSWVPIADHVALTEGLFAETDADHARRICCDTVLRGFDRPFLKPVFRGALAVVGADFSRFAGWAPTALSGMFRGIGELRWAAGEPGSGRLLLEDPHPSVAASAAYIEGFAGAFAALLETTGHEGEVTADTGAASIAFEFRWQV
jgi:hypothetical protein